MFVSSADLSQRLFLIDDYVDFVAVVAIVFVADVAAAIFDVVVSAAVAVIVFHLVVIVPVLFVVAAVVSDFGIVNGDSAAACDFFF